MIGVGQRLQFGAGEVDPHQVAGDRLGSGNRDGLGHTARPGRIRHKASLTTLEGEPGRPQVTESGSAYPSFLPALLVAVFESAGGTICPTGYDGAIGPALLTGAVAVGIGAIVAAFAPGRVSPR